ncbi:peptide chain release factor N(5)-glutamine methyltransferase [Alkalisalibacterium limincola]|uniref:Release factor glutamine methyltransferase n=1 Tax=Alkalisalibacterium limincola TaxID=2699169 RepID=A0A5C8KLR7_9GAMM|nr:peptide chain release factor N(5)-glutamine methyltransferase [Alkalisalibacterium limincola]TXK60541.1 peptide chain release factor N(5)-glutamine methyltransferase [Alkalisalibacterium limincola]
MPPIPGSVSHHLAEAARRLQEGSDSARLDAELMLCHVLRCSRAWLFAHADDPLEPGAAGEFHRLLRRRLQGEPIAHILGRRGFWTLDLAVDASTLIPRPETELLVEAALARIGEGTHLRVLDLGTGTAAVALAIASERPRAEIVAVEQSPGAIDLARRNVDASGLRNVALRQGSWYAPVAGERFSVIVSNPPYIASGDPHLDHGDVRFEPRSALVAGVDGLDDIRVIVAGAAAHLEPGGWLMLEHGHDQGEAVRTLMATAGMGEVGSRQDLAGHERVSFGRLSPSPRHSGTG